MRIITGLLKGRTIPYNPRQQGDIRLTSSLLKEALFAMLGPDLHDQAFLDLCAGCGQIGLEAHSRGARVVLNEPNRQRAAHLETICRQWELEDIDLRRTWAQDLIPDLQEQNQRFDIAYLDPPYRDLLEGQPLVLALLHCFAAADLLTPAGLLFVQHPRQLDLPAEVDQIAVLRRRDYGNTTLSSYQNIAC